MNWLFGRGKKRLAETERAFADAIAHANKLRDSDIEGLRSQLKDIQIEVTERVSEIPTADASVPPMMPVPGASPLPRIPTPAVFQAQGPNEPRKEPPRSASRTLPTGAGRYSNATPAIRERERSQPGDDAGGVRGEEAGDRRRR